MIKYRRIIPRNIGYLRLYGRLGVKFMTVRIRVHLLVFEHSEVRRIVRRTIGVTGPTDIPLDVQQASLWCLTQRTQYCFHTVGRSKFLL